MTHMYATAKTWSPFKGCEFDCSYCRPSFQLQAKRQMHNCSACYNYAPHTHPERLSRIPAADIVFVCGNADISFCDPAFTRQIIAAIKQHNARKPDKTYYFQSKRPEYLAQFVAELPRNAIIVTTLETNRDEDYASISKAPPPSLRYQQFQALAYPRKVVTIEPVMAFDVDTFSRWIIDLRPEYVWLGFNSREAQVRLPEPTEADVQAFVNRVTAAGIEIRGKELRGIELPGVVKTQP